MWLQEKIPLLRMVCVCVCVCMCVCVSCVRVYRFLCPDNCAVSVVEVGFERADGLRFEPEEVGHCISNSVYHFRLLVAFLSLHFQLCSLVALSLFMRGSGWLKLH